MQLSRRNALGGLGLLAAAAGTSAAAQTASIQGPRGDFPFEGTYLNAAYMHPLSRPALQAAEAFARDRLRDPSAAEPRNNPRDGAVARFARLMGVDPADIAVVPSTMSGENLLVQALGVGPGAGVLTDSLHYDGSLAFYYQLSQRGVPVAVVAPRGGRIDLADVKAALNSNIRLIAVSLISSDTGFEHDLHELVALAHARGVMVYVDLIQAAGSIPINLKDSGVDFACSGAYKWLMGDFGAAFLYVRPESFERLKRVQVGWRQLKGHTGHVLPFDPSGPAIGDYQFNSGPAGIFEVGCPAWNTLAVASAGMDYIAAQGGVEALMKARRPLTDRLQEALPRLGLIPLTPVGSRSGVTAFACQDADKKFPARLKAAGLRISVYPNRIRVAPSIYNTADDVDHLAAVLKV